MDATASRPAPDDEPEDDEVERLARELADEGIADGDDDAGPSWEMDWSERAEWLDSLTQAWLSLKDEAGAEDAARDCLSEIRRILGEVR